LTPGRYHYQLWTSTNGQVNQQNPSSFDWYPQLVETENVTAFPSVTVITPDAAKNDLYSFNKAHDLGLNIASKVDESLTGTGNVLRYESTTGNWVKISANSNGDRFDLTKPLVLIADWFEDSTKLNYNSGTAEATADKIFASLIKLDLNEKLEGKGEIGEGTKIYDQKGDLIYTPGSLFNSPFHFIGFGSGGVVNSEIIQRIGTAFPKKDEQGNDTQFADTFPDLQMTTIDADKVNKDRPLASDAIPEPSIEVWDNVTFADNYYQSATEPFSYQLAGADVNIDLGGFDHEEVFKNRVGFTGDAGENRNINKDSNERSIAWYEGTTNINLDRVGLGAGFSNKYPIHRRRGDFAQPEFQNTDFPWYVVDHATGGVIDDDRYKYSQWEGNGTGWYYSLLGNGYYKRPQGDLTKRTPISFDNTAKPRQRGDFAVPTVYDGNFDAIDSKLDVQPIPGWNNENSNGKLQKYLKFGVAGNQSYALELGNGLKSITHNPFVVPDWGTLRFDLRVPELTGGTVDVSMQSDVPGFENHDLGSISLTPAVTSVTGPHTPQDIFEDRLKVDYGQTGFETFNLPVPNALRGKVATLTFEVNGNTVYLDNVFFQSQHLAMDNPSNARYTPENPEAFANNYLIERPQYAISYNKSLKGANWASYQMNSSWLGGNTTSPFFQQEFLLPSSFPKTQHSDYAGSTYFNRGHLTEAQSRTRSYKEHYSTYLTSNILPQLKTMNEGVWSDFEDYLKNFTTQGKEVYVITGGRGSINNDPIWDDLLANDPIRNSDINIPSHFWKVAIVLDKQGLTSDTLSDVQGGGIHQLFAIDIPNDPTDPNFETENWTHWKKSVDWIESQTDYDFLSNLPDEVENRIEANEDFRYYDPSLSASLLSNSIYLASDLSSPDIQTFLKNSISHDGVIESNVANIGQVVDEFSSSEVSFGEVSPFDSSSKKINPHQLSTSQIDLEEVSPFEITSFQDSPLHDSTLKIGSSEIGISESSTSQNGTNTDSFGQIGLAKIGSVALNANQNSFNQIDIPQNGVHQVGFSQVSPTQVSPTEIGSTQTGISQVSPTQISADQLSIPQFDSSQSSLNQISSTEIGASKISFASSISNEQLLSSHNSTPQIINELNNSATKIWSDLLKSETPLNIEFQITDLPSGQLAEASITGFDSSGVPKAGTILIDSDANGVGWFIDSTPLDNSEFSLVGDKADKEETYLLAAAESEASGKYDLLTTVLHELSHLYGFIDGYAGYSDNIETKNDTTKFIGDGFTATLDGEHLDKIAHPYDLLNTHLAPGMRKLPSQLDVQILQSLIATEFERNGNKPEGEELLAKLTSDPLLGITNGDFSITDTTTDSFAWDTRGASKVETGQAVLTEDSPFLSNFSQTFTVPESAKTIQFKLIETELGASELAPPDAFEVALLDANTQESLVSDNDLTETDSLLNIQNDGTAYFSDQVRIGGATSGELINLDKSRTVTIDISNLTPGTEATLYFELLGFGDVDSRVVIDDVRLSDQNLLPPTAVNDTASTAQGQPAIIDILANDTDDDGTITPESVQIQTEPTKGTVTVNNDGTVTYTPSDRFIGEDSFTYTVQDSDGQSSEPAEVEVTVENALPEISEIQISDNITEGDEVTLNATASDPGNDELTYTWEFDDGTTADGRTTKRPYADNGTYTGTLTVTDPHGGSDTQDFEIVVDNAVPVVDAGADQTVDEGSKVNFAGSFTDTGSLDTHSVAWDFADGSTADTNEANHTYADNGTYNATFTVTDSDGAVSSDELTVTVNNVAPTITNLTGDSSVKEGETVNFSATATDPGSDTITYIWDFGDGSETVEGAEASHIFTDNGTYNVTLTASDEDGGETAQTLEVTVENVAPTFTQINGKTTVNEGEAVDYNATATDPGDDELTYTWNFADGTSEVQGANASHTFSQNGVYDAVVTASDDDGAATTSNLSITVNNVAPTITTDTAKTGDEGSSVDFEATFDDTGNDDLTVTWDFGDGSDSITTEYPAESTPNSETQSHVYAADGTYTATVTVTDSDGAVTESTIDVTINNTPPVIETITGDTEINEGDTASFSAIATDAGNDPLTYSWNFGDGSEAITTPDTLTPIPHIYNDNGDYIVTLTVTDSSGATSSSSLDITVNNTNPVISDITDALTINEGDAARLSVTAVDAGADDLTYVWDFGDGSEIVMGENAEHIFADNGLYQASVTVTDDDGASVTQSLSITVKNVAPIADPWLDETATEGDTVEFNLNFSDAGRLDTHTLTWDFGDGSKPLTTNGDETSVSHAYVDNGIYTASVIITDSDGASTTNTMTVTVNNAAPAIASLTGDTNINEGDTAKFAITATDPGSDELTYSWDLGDGQTATGTDISHTYTQNGTYTVTATVTDSDGAATSSTLEVKVNNVAPTIIDLTGDSSIDEGDTATFSATATDPGNDTLTYTWNLEDGTQISGTDVTISQRFVEDSEYDVNLTVTDEEGASATQTLTITVNNVAPIVEAGEDRTSNEGSSVTFNASFSDPGITDTHTIAWDFGDGETTTDTLTPTHIYTNNGEYDVSLTVTDDEGASTTSTLKVTVNNVAPAIASLTGNTQINEGERAKFSVVATDPGSDELTYTWDFGDGETAAGTDSQITHTFAKNGEYTVTATVTDGDGASTNSTFEVTVNNLAPTITQLTGDTEINEGDRASFSATASDAGNDELTYTWNFGDDSETVIGQDVGHIFTDNGEYTVTTTVTDSDGASTTQSLDVKVNNVAPTIIKIEGERTIDEGDTTSLTASTTDPGDDSLIYTWNLADGTQVKGENVTVTQTFFEDGKYDLNLTVTDDDGATATQTVTITVNNVAPIVDVVEDKTGDEGSPVAFNASFSDPGLLDTHTIAWDFGDGSTIRDTLTPTHVYADNGEYDVSLTVTDDEGANTTSTFKVTVNNVTPTITFITGDTEINEGDRANFSAAATDPGADELTYTWNFGDGSETIKGQNTDHQYVQDGTYNTTLTVSDSDGASTSQTRQITVNNLPPTVEAGNNQTVYVGESVSFNGSFSDRGSLDTHTTNWDFGDNTNTNGINNPTHTYTESGIYTVTYSVRDDSNASSNDTLQLTVKKLPTLAVNDISIVEGDNGTANAVFTVSLNEASTRPVAVNYSTANGTAVAGVDYTATTGSITFAPGQTSQSVTIAINGDRLDEIDENLSLNLTSPVNATIADDRGIATIIDNDPVPSLTINDPTITEGDSGTSNLTFTVNLSEASGKIVAVNYSTANGTATAGADYTATTGSITFVPGQTSQSITVPINGDRLDEIDENFSLNLISPVNATIADGTGVGTIIDNDPAPSLSLNDPTITEGDSGNQNLVFDVNLSAASGKTVKVNYSTANGTATAGVDYTAMSGTLTFAPGQTSQTVVIPVTGDRITENNETILLNLTNPVNATIADTQGIGTITDNDLNSYSIKAEGQVFINGSSDFDGVAINPNDDVKIYAGKGFTFNGNQALAVKLDEAGNPILSNGKPVLVDRAVAVAPGYLSSTANAARNQYANLIPPQVIEAQTVTVPAYGNLATQELSRRIPTGTTTVTFNAAQNPLNTLSDWTSRFPAPGTPTRPTVVKVTDGGLNIPSNVNLSNYVITVESGDLNFNGSGHNLNNVMLLTNNGNVNLASVSSKDLSLFASGSINTGSGARFAGNTLLTTGTNNGNITFNGATNTVDESSHLRVISAGDLNYNGASNTRGELISAKNFFFNGSSNLYGSISAKGNITFNGSATVIGIANSSPS
jgi:PKD repeat protein/DNA/RNA endonuclease G (NUC1)